MQCSVYVTVCTRLLVAVFVLPSALAAWGCSGGNDGGGTGEPDCLDQPAELDCNALYGLKDGEIQPTFHDVWENTLSDTCAVAGCHNEAAAQGGMILEPEQRAYDMLLSKGSDDRPRVIPNDVQCGKVIVRLETPGETWSMPPGSHLSEGELCAIRHWIDNGAPR